MLVLSACVVYSVLPFNISPNQIVITNNYEVVFTTVASFLSLTPSQTEPGTFERYVFTAPYCWIQRSRFVCATSALRNQNVLQKGSHFIK